MRTLFLLAVLCGCSLAQFSKSGQDDIVNAHNTLRSSIAKGTYVANGTKKESGTNILKIKWDSTVAASAQAYANKCPTGHSDRKERNGYGENLFWSWGQYAPKDLDEFGLTASNVWSSEFEKFGWKTNKMDGALFSSGVGHATQMAWANTGAIGCGVKNCGTVDSTVVVVCQYKGSGNFMGQDIYKTGKTCAECPEKTTCEEASGLCVEVLC